MASGKASTSVNGHAVVSTFRPVPVLMAMPVPAPFTIVSVNWLGVHSDASRVSSSCRQYALVLIFLSQPEWFKLRSQLISSLLGLPLRLSLEKSALLAEAFWLFSKTLSASHVIKTLIISHVT